jgi:hypothetical protein
LNSSDQIKKFLSTLALSFPGDVPQSKLAVYFELLSDELKSKNLKELLLRLTAENNFFPSVKIIMDHASEPKQSTKDRAVFVVERYIQYLRGALKYEEIGDYDHAYCKKRFGADKHGVQSGAIDLNFRRKEWIDICEIDFEIFEKTGDRPWMPKQGAIPGNVTKLLDWGKDVD